MLFLAFNAGIVVLIWLVQLVIYPSFRHIDESEFVDWHASYTTRVSFVVIPLMFGQVGMISYEFYENGFLPVLLLQGLFVFVAWVVTFAISVPCHNVLSEKKSGKEIERLIKTNWIRTAVWTAVLLLDIPRMFS